MEGLVDPLTALSVQSYVDSIECDNFGTILTEIQTRLDRQLPKEEKCFIAAALRSRRLKSAEIHRRTDSLYSKVPTLGGGSGLIEGNILIVTAYSDDYTIGFLCEAVNRCYAARHGYEFLSEVLPLDVISSAIAPKKHCTWYKIALVKKLLADVSYLESKQIEYIMWIDADAIVVDQGIKLTDIIERCGGKDLIIAEDMNTGCLINAGVFLLRTTHWSRDFIDDVWDCVKYNDVTFYEQSSMIRMLRTRKEDLESVSPFHSYLPNAEQGVKLFPHTAVLPLAEFNSNKGILCNDVKAYEAYMTSLQSGEKRTPAVDANLDSVATNNQNGDYPVIMAKVKEGVFETAAQNKGNSKKLVVPSHCYQATGNFCTLCQRTVGNNLKRVAGATIDSNPALFVYHPAGMPDKLTLLYSAIHKYKVPYDFASNVMQSDSANDDSRGVSGAAPAPLRLVRGKCGQIPQAGQLHLLSRMTKQS